MFVGSVLTTYNDKFLKGVLAQDFNDTSTYDTGDYNSTDNIPTQDFTDNLTESGKDASSDNFDSQGASTDSESNNDDSGQTTSEQGPTPNNEIRQNFMPVANAGPDFEVDEQSNVMLDGSSSTDEDGSIATYSWNQVGGPPLELNDDQSVAPSFTAPNVDSNQQFTFQVSVTDNEGSSDTDTVNILVKDLASEEIKQPSDSDS
jgi:hypothetical protein